MIYAISIFDAHKIYDLATAETPYSINFGKLAKEINKCIYTIYKKIS